MKLTDIIRRVFTRRPDATLIPVPEEYKSMFQSEAVALWNNRAEGLAPTDDLPDFRQGQEPKIRLMEASAILALHPEAVHFALAAGALKSLTLSDIRRFQDEQPQELWQAVQFYWPEADYEAVGDEIAPTVH